VGDPGRTDNHAVTTRGRLEDRQRFVRLLHRGLGLGAFFDAADRALADLLAFDSACWLSLDPATLLPTSHFTRELGAEQLWALAAKNEFLEDDVNKFADLTRAARPVGILSQATGGNLWRSPRYAKVLAPHGFGDGDELRAVFLDGGSAWGCVALHRRRGRFSDREAGLVAEVGGLIGQGIRRAILQTALAADGVPEPPGLILLGGDGSVEAMTAPARRWLGELVDSTSDGAVLPLLVASVAEQARRAAAGQIEQVASVRLPRRSGGWLLVDASPLDADTDGRVAVMVHPASQPELAGLIVEAYGLSRREREVTRLVLHGRSTREIADDLHVSAYTVQDHLKAVFAKVGVSSRRELVAQLFLQHYAPRLQARAAVGTDGWFADASSAERLANGRP
jgi:DNA-binding CsgD family transcriptional regulator